MESEPNYYLLIVLITLSAYFSASESAFFSLGKLHLKKLESETTRSAKRVVRLLKKPRHLLITILLGNTVVNIWASTLAALYFSRFVSNTWGIQEIPFSLIFLLTVVMTIVIVVFGEITPKIIALAKADSFARKSAIIIEPLMYALFPIVYILLVISNLFSKKSEQTQINKEALTSQDLKNLLDSNSVNHPLDDYERQIISGIFKFSSVEAKNIMVPRVDIKGISIDESIENIKEEIITSGFSRLPVYKGSIDSVIGVLYVKDLVLNPGAQSINSLLRKPIYVTENAKVQVLLNSFKTRKTHLAIVTDEYGGTSGLLTLEDVLEELVGEIIDEYDNEESMLTKISDKEYKANGMLNIFDLNQALGCNIDTEKYDNLAALLYDTFNRVPELNEEIEFNDYVTFVVTGIKGQRIESVKIILNNENDADEF